MRCALVEAETREEVMEEMEERMRAMEKMFKRRLMKEVCPADQRSLQKRRSSYMTLYSYRRNKMRRRWMLRLI